MQLDDTLTFLFSAFVHDNRTPRHICPFVARPAERPPTLRKEAEKTSLKKKNEFTWKRLSSNHLAPIFSLKPERKKNIFSPNPVNFPEVSFLVNWFWGFIPNVRGRLERVLEAVAANPLAGSSAACHPAPLRGALCERGTVGAKFCCNCTFHRVGSLPALITSSQWAGASLPTAASRGASIRE